MGVFGTGLYSGDFAMDLRSTIGAVSRLPFDPDRLVDIIIESEPGAATRPEDEDHTIFWLVLADQFAKRGIDSARVRNQALDILDRDLDLAMFQRLGATAIQLRQRRKVLDEVRTRIAAPIAPKKRPVLAKPQPYLMELGDVFLYPTSGGDNINPYFKSKELLCFRKKDGSIAWQWQQDGWGAFVVADRGRVFDYLAWYRLVNVARAFPEKPSLDSLLDPALIWKLNRPGTCTALHIKRMEFERIGSVPISLQKLQAAFGELYSARSAAINDISIANHLDILPKLRESALAPPGQPPNRRLAQSYATIQGLQQLLG